MVHGDGVAEVKQQKRFVGAFHLAIVGREVAVPLGRAGVPRAENLPMALMVEAALARLIAERVVTVDSVKGASYSRFDSENGSTVSQV